MIRVVENLIIVEVLELEMVLKIFKVFVCFVFNDSLNYYGVGYVNVGEVVK